MTRLTRRLSAASSRPDAADRRRVTPKVYSDGDVLDTRLWRFYVVHNTALEGQIREGKRASLTTIAALATPTGVAYAELKNEIDRVLQPETA